MPCQHKFANQRGAIFAALCAAALAMPLFADPVQINPADYAKSFTITFPGYSGGTTLTDFPVLIRLSAARNAFDYSKCKVVNGGDLRFADSDGNLLASEVDTWNPQGESLVWVKVPTLNADTVITAYYGNANPVEMDSKQVWSNGFVGVWHMGDSTLPMTDSVNGGTSLTATLSGSTLPGQPGLAGNAIAFDQLNSHQGCLQTTDQRYKTSGRPDFTVEFWSYQNSFEPTDPPYSTTYMQEKGSSAIWRVYDIDNTKYGSNGKTVVTVSLENAKPDNPSTGDRYPNRAEWVYQNFRVSNSSQFYQGLYQDGYRNSRIASMNYSNQGGITNDTANTTLFIGNTSSGSTTAFPGMIDEVRISSVARSDDWMDATYDTIHDGDFAVAVLPNDWTRYTHTFSISFPGATNGVLSDYPVLVKISESAIPGFHYADCLKENGGDLRFADAEGNMLDSEVETWNTNGESFVWVKVPSLANNTAIKAYYGWTFAPVVDPKSVWSNGYVGVWHLGESESPLKTSVSGASDFKTFPGTQKAPDTSGGIRWAQTGVVGSSVNFEKEGIYTNNCLTAGHLDVYEGMSAITLEAWTYRESSAEKNGGYVLDLTQRTASNQAYYMCDRANRQEVEVVFYTTNLVTGTGIKTQLRSGNSAFSADTWVYQAASFDNAITGENNAFLYINGVLKTSGSGGDGTIKATGSGSLYLGNQQNYTGYTHPFPGKIDEVRISNVARSAGWLATTYDMIKGNANFATYSAAREQTRGFVVIIR